MPIFDYQCSACGHRDEVLQKLSDAPLSVCPACGKDAYAKCLSAAGFQLKGSGWYATDFKGGSTASSAPEPAPAAAHACGTGGCGGCA
ncbi:zinc ribbon domain-containing protein [Burkholderiaceae bacterium DAT-1]|nr:zinc ribbon domain-containing protein [Burkholderiaceae bacterium DAT-1]